VRGNRFIGGHVTTIGLTSAIYLACLLASVLLIWPVRAASTMGFGDARRALLAMYRATDAGLVKCLRATVAVICIALISWALSSLVTSPAANARSGVYQIAYTIVAGLSGAAVANLAAYLTVRWARAAALRTVISAFSNADRLLLTVLRSSLSLALFIEVAGFAISAGIFALCWALQTTVSSSGGAAVLLDTLRALVNFTIGALLASFVLQTSGTTYRIAAQIGTSVASREANLPEIDPRNPSAIADTAGVQLGQLIPHMLDAFCSALCVNALVVLALWRSVGTARLSVEHSYLLLPIVMRAFGALASVFGAGAARSLESRSPAAAFLRAEAVYIVVALGAICGCAIWLTPEFSIRLSLCGIMGLLFPFLLSHWQGFIVSRQLRAVARQSADNSWNAGLILGLTGLAVPLLALVALLTFIIHIGAPVPIANARIFSLMLCLLGMNIAIPFSVTLQSTLPLIVLARRAAFFVKNRRDDAGQRRLIRLEEATRVASSRAISVQTQCAVGIPLLAACAIGTMAKDSGARSFGTEAFAALAVCSIAFVMPMALGLATSSRASKALVNEVRRQLSGFSRDAGLTQIPAEFTPSYRTCVDVAAREATKRLSSTITAVVAPTLMLGLTLVWLTKSPGLVGQALAMYLGQVAVASCVAGFVFEVASDFAGNVRARSSRTLLAPELSAGDCVLHHLAFNSTPAVRLLAKTSVIAVLTFVPYMF